NVRGCLPPLGGRELPRGGRVDPVHLQPGLQPVCRQQSRRERRLGRRHPRVDPSAARRKLAGHRRRSRWARFPAGESGAPAEPGGKLGTPGANGGRVRSIGSGSGEWVAESDRAIRWLDHGAYAEAVAEFARAESELGDVRAQALSTSARVDLAAFHFRYAIALEGLGRHEDAIAHWELAVELDP